MNDIEAKINEHETKINGIAKSLDHVKADQQLMRSHLGEVKGIALSADRGFHVLSDRVDKLGKNQEKLEGKLDRQTDLILGLYKSNSAQMFKIIGAVATLVGLMVAIIKLI